MAGALADKSLAEPGIFCKSSALCIGCGKMGKTLFSGRLALALCVIASICCADNSFAQTPIPYDGKPTIIGRWKLVTINGSVPEGQTEEIEFEDERLRVREDCNSATYTYVINDGQMTAVPDGITLAYCDDDRTHEEELALHNQEAIVSAIVHSKVVLNGDSLRLVPMSPSGEIVFHRLDWFEIGRRPGP
jgi:heat shock protein HslJ